MKTGYSFGSLASFVETINNTTVKLTGDQTIAGIKTFSSNPISSAAQGTGGSYLTRKDYVDGALALKAPLASPTLTGTPTAPTAAAGTNTTQIATTAFVTASTTAQLGAATPLMDGTATVGTSTLLSRQDHVHPTDTSRAPLASPALTGTPTAPTPTQFSADTKIATMEAVQRALGSVRNYTPINTSTTLTAANVGTLIATGTSGVTLTVPTPTSIGATMGSQFSFLACNVPATIAAASGCNIVDTTLTTAAPITLAKNTGVVLTAISTTGWIMSHMEGYGLTPSADDNSTRLATTAFVNSAIVAIRSAAVPLMDGTADVGVSTLLSRQDHVHPTDTSRAPLASPALSGTPTAPTAVAGTNTTQLATTAFVQTANATAVKITNDQTIAGIKTFSSNPISSAAQGTGGSHLTRKDYVDGRVEFIPIIANITVSSTQNYRFMARAIATLPSSGGSIRFIVDHSVDLKSEDCIIQAPAGETIVAPRGSDNQVRIKKVGREFVFVRINNQWRVS